MSNAFAPAADRRAWRPQAFGSKGVRQIGDPIIEPVWEGERVLAHVEAGAAEIVTVQGEPITDLPEIAAAVASAASAGRLVLDGYLTTQAARPSLGVVPAGVRAPTSGEMVTQMFLGRGRRVRHELAESMAAGPVREGETVVFVAVDLLAIDDDPLLDVPLLERKRLLESALGENDLVRVGVFVRPPVDAWLGSWRALGFRSLAYKAANSRYLPGARNDSWAIARIPQR